MPRPHVVILVAPDDRFQHLRYFLHAMTDVWQEWGVRVSVRAANAPAVQADLAILHTDITVVPPDCRPLPGQYPRVLNGLVTDISKRRISTHLLRRDEAYNGPVIVKTNFNSGGWREQRQRWSRGPISRLTDRVRRRLPWSFRAHIPTGQYPVLPSTGAVPWPVWRNPDLVVEKFLAERRGALYCLRTWVFFGPEETHSLSLSTDPVVKLHTIIHREPLPEVPEALQQLRRQLHFDFGKFDYVMVNGKPVLYDANRTPVLGGMKPEAYLPRIRLLAQGLGAFLPQAVAVPA